VPSIGLGLARNLLEVLLDDGGASAGLNQVGGRLSSKTSPRSHISLIPDEVDAITTLKPEET